MGWRDIKVPTQADVQKRTSELTADGVSLHEARRTAEQERRDAHTAQHRAFVDETQEGEGGS